MTKNNVTRRRVVQGIAWSTPAVVATVAAPAYAASTPCDAATTWIDYLDSDGPDRGLFYDASTNTLTRTGTAHSSDPNETLDYWAVVYYRDGTRQNVGGAMDYTGTEYLPDQPKGPFHDGDTYSYSGTLSQPLSQVSRIGLSAYGYVPGDDMSNETTRTFGEINEDGCRMVGDEPGDWCQYMDAVEKSLNDGTISSLAGDPVTYMLSLADADTFKLVTDFGNTKGYTLQVRTRDTNDTWTDHDVVNASGTVTMQPPFPPAAINTMAVEVLVTDPSGETTHDMFTVHDDVCALVRQRTVGDGTPAGPCDTGAVWTAWLATKSTVLEATWADGFWSAARPEGSDFTYFTLAMDDKTFVSLDMTSNRTARRKGLGPERIAAAFFWAQGEGGWFEVDPATCQVVPSEREDQPNPDCDPVETWITYLNSGELDTGYDYANDPAPKAQVRFDRQAGEVILRYVGENSDVSRKEGSTVQYALTLNFKDGRTISLTDEREYYIIDPETREYVVQFGVEYEFRAALSEDDLRELEYVGLGASVLGKPRPPVSSNESYFGKLETYTVDSTYIERLCS